MRKEDYKLINEAMQTSNAPRENPPPGSAPQANVPSYKPNDQDKKGLYGTNTELTNQYSSPRSGQPEMIGEVGEPAAGVAPGMPKMPRGIGARSSIGQAMQFPEPGVDNMVQALKSQQIDPVQLVNNPQQLNAFARSLGKDAQTTKAELNQWIHRAILAQKTMRSKKAVAANNEFQKGFTPAGPEL